VSPVRKGAVLVTGGAGYVGSFAVRALVRRGVEVVVLDDLSKGHRKAVPPVVPLVRARVQDGDEVRRVLRSRRFDAILHFAADAYVGESMREPAKYWRNNVGGTLSLLDAAVECGVPGFVFSSSCAVYGEPGGKRIPETAPRRPVNPYGRTKATCEELLEDLGSVGAIRSFRLRYFNAAGGAADGSLGEDHDPETHLVPLAIRAAAEGGTLRILGTDYPTKDGTCVRDFVHVEDLADAHAAAVMRLREGHPGGAYNLGTGKGASVLQVVRAVQKVTGRQVRTEPGPRRPGDPPVLVAAPGEARQVLGFEPQYKRLEDLVATAWAWHRRRPHGFPPERTREEE
jgi:UDP-glucose-4-epimerase GalE